MAKANTETLISFSRRVKEATGVAFFAIPAGVEEDLLDGSILCRRGTTYVVSHGYPTGVDGDGGEFWGSDPGNFRTVVL